MHSQTKVLVGDFETTVYENQTSTEVWASALVELYTENVIIFHSIDETFEHFKLLNENLDIYYHNLKFDGAFWLAFLLNRLHLQQAIHPLTEGELPSFYEDKDMPNNTFKYLISDMGAWYSITIKLNNHYIRIKDSLKLLPFSVAKIGKGFKTKHQKLDMEYKGFRYAGCTITDEEKSYIANDVLVVKEALEIMFNEGHSSLTIGSCCMKEFKSSMSIYDYNTLFPDLYEYMLDPKLYYYDNADAYIRRSYKGGWCYLVKGKEGYKDRRGITADVNSLYPSMMSSESGNYYPVGKPHFWKGKPPYFITSSDFNKNPDEPHYYYFIRIRTRFYLKPNYLPCIQIKGDPHYKPTDWLVTSDIYSKQTQQYYDTIADDKGNTRPALVTLTLTMTDYELIKEHYVLKDFEILDGCWFNAEIGIFDKYIDKYKTMKMNNKGALRELAKLFLNNLYGKLAASKCSSFKYAYLTEEGTVAYIEVEEQNKKAGYIACGSAITSYARNFTIRAAQKNYHGVHERGFIYADTDSIHCDLEPEEVVGITVHPTNFCCWKLESTWDEATFIRQKTYAEHIVEEDLEPLPPEKVRWNIKCAGLPERSKDFFLASMRGWTEEEWKEKEPDEWKEMADVEKEFVLKKRYITDFVIGIKIPGKLLPKTIQGGIVLCDTIYTMR